MYKERHTGLVGAQVNLTQALPSVSLVRTQLFITNGSLTSI